MGIGHDGRVYARKPNHKYAHGGELRKLRAGRKHRPLSNFYSIHLVLKANRVRIRTLSLRTHRNFAITHKVVARYSRRFEIKIIQMSIQGDHVHLHIRASKRAQYQSFFRVLAGQVAQVLKTENCLRIPVTDTQKVLGARGTKLWFQRPYTRVVRGRFDYGNVQDYVRLNEKEARGEIRYRKERLRGLTAEERKNLWKGATRSDRDRYPSG